MFPAGNLRAPNAESHGGAVCGFLHFSAYADNFRLRTSSYPTRER
jgi:hypothetical protein